MKVTPLVLATIMVLAPPARAQDTDTVDSREPAADPVASPVTARILGDIPDGTPPPPQAPKPKFVISEKEVLQTTTHEQGGRTITIRKIKPIALPPPPAPVEQSIAEVDDEFRARLAEYRAAHPKSGMLFLGATVFRSKDSPPRTLVRFWPKVRGESISFWSSADFALIAGGIKTFVDTAGDTHSIFMSWSNVDIDRMTDRFAAKGREYDAPDTPDFPEGMATFKIIGNQPAAEDLVPIQALHDLYNSEFQRLKIAYEGRERARIEREAYLKAHPPQPKDITLNYWRTERPASAKGGAK